MDGTIETNIRIADIKKMKCNEFMNLLTIIAIVIFDTATNTLIGSTRFYEYKPELSSVAIGYTFLATKFWGGIYNKSVKKLMLDYAFQFVNSVLFHIGATNIRSQKAILKIGAKKINEVNLDYFERKLLHYEYEIRNDEWNK